MRNLLRSTVLCALLASPAIAEPVVSGSYYPMAGTAQYALSIGTNTTLTVPAGASGAEICVETAGVRYTDDGTSASSSTGIPVAAGVCFQYFGNPAKMKFTAQTGSPTIDVSYYKLSE